MTDTLTVAPGETRSDQDTPQVPDERQRYIDGLLMLADVLKNHPEVPLPVGSPITISFLSGGDARDRMAAAARAFPIKWEKNFWDSQSGTSYFDLEGKLAGLQVEMRAYRDAVCERVVTGTREVTEKVKDPDRLAEVPEIEVTRTVEDVTWECGSLLAPRPAVAGEAPKAAA